MLDNGGNTYIDSYRGNLTSIPEIIENDELGNDALIARIKAKIAREAASMNVEKKVAVQKEALEENQDNLMSTIDISSLCLKTTVIRSQTTRTKKREES